MSQNIQELLQKLNFSDNDQKVYLAVLKLGRALALNISKATKVERTTTFRMIFEMCWGSQNKNYIYR